MEFIEFEADVIVLVDYIIGLDDYKYRLKFSTLYQKGEFVPVRKQILKFIYLENKYGMIGCLKAITMQIVSLLDAWILSTLAS